MIVEERFAIAAVIRNPSDKRTLFGLRSGNYHDTFADVWSLPSMYISPEEALKINVTISDILNRLSMKKLSNFPLGFKDIIRYAQCSRKEYNLHMYLVLAIPLDEKAPFTTVAYDELRFLTYNEFWNESKEYGFCGLCTALYSEWLFSIGEIMAPQIISRVISPKG